MPESAFISYCRDDSEFALRLAQDLKAAGANVWLDQLDIVPGHHWDNAIEDALNAATQMLIVLSPASAKSTNVRDEISYALEQGKIVIPVLYMDCTVPLRLQRMQRIDFRADYARGLASLLRNLQVANPDQAVLERAAEGDTQRQAAWQAREVEAARLKELAEEQARQQRQAESLRKEAAPEVGRPSEIPEERAESFGSKKKILLGTAAISLLLICAGIFVWRRSATDRTTATPPPPVAQTSTPNQAASSEAQANAIPAGKSVEIGATPTPKTSASAATERALAGSTVVRPVDALPQVRGDAGLLSGPIASNHGELEELRSAGKRAYFEFTLSAGTRPQQVGPVTLQVKNVRQADSSFTLAVDSDGHPFEKSNKHPGEPVQFYGGVTPMLFEVVVFAVRGNEVNGYLSAPMEASSKSGEGTLSTGVAPAPSVIAASLYQQALADYNREDYVDAVSLYDQACASGEPEGCAGLASLYARGKGVSKDHQKAVALFQKGCDGGFGESCWILGKVYENGAGIAQDLSKAKQLFQKGCGLGYQSACDALKNAKFQ